MTQLSELLGDDLRRHVRVQVAVANHHTLQFGRASGLGLGPALLADQGPVALSVEGREYLVIAASAVAVLGGGSGGPRLAALTLDQHE